MVELSNPFDQPEAAINPTADRSELKQQWDMFLENPQGRSALMNFGLALMQPVGLGQTPAGHVAQAFGNTGRGLSEEEKRRQAQQMLDIRGEEADSRMSERERRAGTRDDAAAIREERLRLSQDALRLREEQLRATDERARRKLEIDADKQKRKGLGDLFRINERRAAAADALAEREAMSIYTAITKNHSGLNEQINGPVPEQWLMYKGKTPQQIADMLRQSPEFKARIDKQFRSGVPVPGPVGAPPQAPAVEAGEETDEALPPNAGPTSGGPPIGATQEPPPQAVNALKQNPSLAAQFDAKYGPGMSAVYLGR